jgi:hypothetical protein
MEEGGLKQRGGRGSGCGPRWLRMAGCGGGQGVVGRPCPPILASPCPVHVQVGWATFVGLGVMLLLTPATGGWTGLALGAWGHRGHAMRRHAMPDQK